METTAELGGMIAERRARVATLRRLIEDAAIQAMTDGGALAKRALLREELDAIPAQVGELVRRRFLTQLADWRAQVAELRPQLDAANQLDDEYRARNGQFRKAIDKALSEAEREDLRRDWRAIKEPSEAASLAYEKLRNELMTLYAWAAQAGVFLDQSQEQRQFAAQLPPMVSHASADGETHWDTLARRAGQAAEKAARN